MFTIFVFFKLDIMSCKRLTEWMSAGGKSSYSGVRGQKSYNVYIKIFLIAGVMAVNGIGMGGDGDQAHLTDEERKAAALRVIRRAKQMALPGRDRAYSTCETGLLASNGLR